MFLPILLVWVTYCVPEEQREDEEHLQQHNFRTALESLQGRISVPKQQQVEHCEQSIRYIGVVITATFFQRILESLYSTPRGVRREPLPSSLKTNVTPCYNIYIYIYIYIYMFLYYLKSMAVDHPQFALPLDRTH